MKNPTDLVKNDPKADHGTGPTKNSPIMVEDNSIGNLPRDLVIQIVSRLPVKVLCRFRLVSMQWLHLLSHDKHFMARHSQQSKTDPLLIFRKYYSNEAPKDEMEERIVVELTSVNMKGQVLNKMRAPVEGPVNTFTSCGPLVLMCCPYQIYLCNPSIEECVRVPLSSSMPRYCTVGFGRCSSSSSSPVESFKIVHLFPYGSFVGGDQGMGCEIFCVSNGKDVNLGSWRRTVDCPYKVRTHGLSVCVCGFNYWMVSDEANNSEKKSILSFDLESEKFEAISYPRSYSDSHEHNLLFLTGFNNYLALVDSSPGTLVTDIWVLKDRKKKIWVNTCSFDLSTLGVSGSNSNVKIRGVVPCDGNGNDVGGIVIDTEQHGLVLCNLETKLFTEIQTQSEERYKLPCLYYDGFFSLHA